MATKKSGSSKKTSKAKNQVAKTKVTTVKAASAARKRKPLVSLNVKANLPVAVLVGEFVGTFLLAAGYLITKGEPLYMGFIYMTLVLVVGSLSGAYLNPLLTFGAWVTRKVNGLRALAYVLAQLFGATAAFLVLNAFVNANHVDSNSAANAFAQTPQLFKLAAVAEKTQWFVFAAELLGATVFAFAFAGLWREKSDRVAQALGAGFGLFVAALVAGVCASYVSAQVALNPVLALAAQAVDVSKINWFAVAVYVVAPLAGGVLGYALRDAVDTKK